MKLKDKKGNIFIPTNTFTANEMLKLGEYEKIENKPKEKVIEKK